MQPSTDPQTPFGRALPAPPLPPMPDELALGDDVAEDQNDLDAAMWTTPRPPRPVRRLARRIVTASVAAKHWIAFGGLAFALWAIGTALAIVIGRGALVLGFGGFALGIGAGALWFARRYREALAIARDGQLITGVTTFRRSRETFGGELSETFDALLGDRRHSVVFSIGFLRHEVRVAFGEPRFEGEPCSVLVRPGARHALAFDAHGTAHAGELLRIR